MARKNYFEILGLPFDPLPTNDKAFERQFNEVFRRWQTAVQEQINNPQSDAIKQQYVELLSYADDIQKVMKDKKSRNAEAVALRKERMEQLERLLDLMLAGESGSPEVTKGHLRAVGSKLGLAESSVSDVYAKKGFVVRKSTGGVKLNDFFMGTATFDTINQQLRDLAAAGGQQYPWAAKVTDLYSLACFYSGDSDVDKYRRMSTDELRGKMDAAAHRLTGQTVGAGGILSHLTHSGATQVFADETKRRLYDNSLKLAELRDFFVLLRQAPDVFKRERFFADRCIDVIKKHFRDADLALALYNREAGIQQDPYEPLELGITVYCPSCHVPHTFLSRADAEKAQCVSCGTALYMTCPSCGKKAPAAASRCACGFLLSEMQHFEEYLKRATFALNEMDLTAARRYLEEARNAWPGNPKLAPLEKRLKEEGGRYQQQLDQLQALMADGRFEEAQRAVADLAVKAPQLRLDGYRKEIGDKLETVRRMMPPATASPADAANRCMEILHIVKDYQPAVERLRTLPPPRPPQQLAAAVKDSGKLTFLLTWSSSGDSGVTYKVVRKRGGVPAAHTDGEPLADGLTVPQFEDSGVIPGVRYGYSVFANRFGVFSAPESRELVHFGELNESQLKVSAEDGTCSLSWTLPPNCVGVRVLRCVGAIPAEQPGGNTTVAAADATSFFTDKQVQNGTRYGYRLQCVYADGTAYTYSKGRTVTLIPEEPPRAVNDPSVTVDNRMVTVKWTPAKTGQSVAVWQLPTGHSVKPGMMLPATEVASAVGGGAAFITVDAAAGQCRFTMGDNTSVELALVVGKGSRCLISAVLRASSVRPCVIDRTATRINGEGLSVVLEPLPPRMKRLHYTVLVKTDKTVPWATVEDARAGRMQRVSVEQYERDGMIYVDKLPKDDLYVSVIGEYDMSGTPVFAETARIRVSNKPRQLVSYRIYWEKNLLGRKKKEGQLALVCEGEMTPALHLVYRADGHIPMKLEDPETLVLVTIPETEEGFPNGRYAVNLPVDKLSALPSGTALRLMMDETEMTRFEMYVSGDIQELKVP